MSVEIEEGGPHCDHSGAAEKTKDGVDNGEFNRSVKQGQQRGRFSTEQIERARSVPLERLLERVGHLRKMRREGAEMVGPCPRCNGGDDRFSIHLRKQVFNCRHCDVGGGGAIDLAQFLYNDCDFLTAVGTVLSEQPKTEPKSAHNAKDKSKDDGARKEVAATYQYMDAGGHLVFEVQRFHFRKPHGGFVLTPEGKPQKTFRQRRPDPSKPDCWIHDVEGVETIPYRLPELLEAIAADRTVPIFVVEGEAKVDALRSWGFTATCCACGAEKWRTEHSEFLRGWLDAARLRLFPHRSHWIRQNRDRAADCPASELDRHQPKVRAARCREGNRCCLLR
jgi:hypothetical protein